MKNGAFITILAASTPRWPEEPPPPRFLGCPTKNLVQKHARRRAHRCSWGRRPRSHPATPQTGTRGCASSRGRAARPGFCRSTGTASPRPRCHRPRCWGGNGREMREIAPVPAIAQKAGCRRCGLTCRPATPSTRWDAGTWGAARWSLGAPGCPGPPRPPRGCTPCTAPAKPPGRTSPSEERHG